MKFALRIKSFVVIVLTACIIFPILTVSASAQNSGFSNFSRTRSYTQGQFTDVPEGQWYTDYVAVAYELELVEGVGNDTFKPAKSITVAETITLASKLHNIYHGRTHEFETSSPWYQTYVDYAVDTGIIYEDQFSKFSVAATRADFAVVFANALPVEALVAINSITKIPDVQEAAPYADAVYRLYNAGIFCGNDAYGTFNPDSEIKRNEVATILTRMAEPSARKTFELYTLQEESFDTFKNWIYNNCTTSLNGNMAYYESLNSGIGVKDQYWYTYEPDSDSIFLHHEVKITNKVNCLDLRLSREGKDFLVHFYIYERDGDPTPIMYGECSVNAPTFNWAYTLNFSSIYASDGYNHIENAKRFQSSASEILRGTLDHLDQLFDMVSDYGHCNLADFGFDSF